MRKILLLTTLLAIIGGSAYALFPGLFPDNETFPRVPTAPGTIGAILSRILGISDLGNYSGDGTVKNSEKLGGKSADTFLKQSICSSGSFTGIDMRGQATCGTSTPILAHYGTIETQDCDADYYRADGTSGKTATGSELKSGDIVKTPPGCGATIAFEDLSYIRLDGDTTVSLDLGTRADGQTIASAIVENGSLWGRILTETGVYSIGTRDVVAGVRGTSISVEQTGGTISPITQTYIPGGGASSSTPSTSIVWQLSVTPTLPSRVSVIDTTSSVPTEVECKNGGVLRNIGDMTAEHSYVIPVGGCPTTTETALSTPPSSLFSGSPWVRKNTRKDLIKLYRILSDSGSTLTSSKYTKVQNELTQTQPSSTTEQTNLCNTGEKWWNTRYGCQLISLYAKADYTIPTLGTEYPKMITTSNGNSISPSIGGVLTFEPTGVAITQSGQYIQYSNPDFIGQLAGKTITIELASVPTSCNSNKCFLVDTGTERWFIFIGKNCNGTSMAGKFLCKVGDTTSVSYNDALAINITFGVGVYPPTMLLIGNSSASAPTYNFPLGATIKKISLSN